MALQLQHIQLVNQIAFGHLSLHKRSHRILLAPSMTGYSDSLVLDGEDDGGERRFSGEALVLGPLWARLPSLTVGHLGVSVLWSLEMSSGACGSSVTFLAHMY